MKKKSAKAPRKSNGNGIQETLNFIVEHMATKDDVREIVHEKIKPLTDEMHSMRTDIRELKESVDNLKGLPKEIDHVISRVSAVEKQIGIQPKTSV